MSRLDEITHPSHAAHKLKLDFADKPFTCNGCKERGVGWLYTCAICSFSLHHQCATASPSFHHPFFRGCSFRFVLNPPENLVCDACRKEVRGFVYRCWKSNRTIDLHPRCAILPMVLDQVGDTELCLNRELSTLCDKCGRTDKRLWSYRPRNEEFQRDVGCVKEMMEEQWQVLFQLAQAQGLNAPNNRRNQAQHRNALNNNVNFKEFCKLVWLPLRAVILFFYGDPRPLIDAVDRWLVD